MPLAAEGASSKAALRALVLRRRTQRSPAVREAAGRDLADRFLALPEVAAASVVAAYVSDGTEPATGSILQALAARGETVLLPVVGTGPDLDWAAYSGGSLRAGRYGLQEPTTPRLGPEAIATADVVVCPCVAVDSSGGRLGRGGGYYDRALTRCRPAALICTLAYDDEVVVAVPLEPHDVRVDAVVTPTRTLRTRAPLA